MPKVKLGPRREITLPAATVKQLGLTAGEELEVVANEKAILLIPRKRIPKDQAWYYTETWQRMMQEAFEEVKQGKLVGPFETAEELIRALKDTQV
ncbi:MAG: AbrB/MazE/SpoVT family DNA-binding domain-containing protein [Candidatus Latescibacteria bacterium]|nr:AbrB/MazE/SpoVT family DNA-binding domain-containing protein [Candidatus Latescibacterota bacterium]